MHEEIIDKSTHASVGQFDLVCYKSTIINILYMNIGIKHQERSLVR